MGRGVSVGLGDSPESGGSVGFEDLPGPRPSEGEAEGCGGSLGSLVALRPGPGFPGSVAIDVESGRMLGPGDSEFVCVGDIDGDSTSPSWGP